MTIKAIWNGTVVAEAEDTVVVEGNHYFPRESLIEEHFTPSRTRTICPWKGLASYSTVTVGGAANVDAAWEYLHPSPLARKIKGRVAFSRGIDVIVDDASRARETTR